MKNGEKPVDPKALPSLPESSEPQASSLWAQIRYQLKHRAFIISLLLAVVVLPLLMTGIIFAWQQDLSWYRIVPMMFAGILLALFLIWKVPTWQVDRFRQKLEAKDEAGLEIEARSTLIQIVGGVAVIASIAFTAANLQLTAKNVASAEENFQATNELARFTQITERYSNAVKQLQDTNMGVRLAGIYTLGILAHETADLGKSKLPNPKPSQSTLVLRANEYHKLIVLVLAAHVRSSSPRISPAPVINLKTQTQAAAAPLATQSIPQDIQTILTVIGTRDVENEKFVVDLRGSDLHGAVIEGNFENADFTKSDLSSAHLSATHLHGANFTEVNLAGAEFSAASMEAAVLTGATLSNTIFRQTNLKGAKLNLAQIDASTFDDSEIEGVDFQNAHGDGSYLTRAQLTVARNVSEAFKVTIIE